MSGYATDMLAKREARIAQLETDLKSLAKSCEIRAGSPAISNSESDALRFVAFQIRRALNPDDYIEEDY